MDNFNVGFSFLTVTLNDRKLGTSITTHARQMQY